MEEILKVIIDIGIDEERFLEHFKGDTAKSALNMDLQFAERLGIRTLPAYLIEYNDEGALFQELLNYDSFVTIIDKLTKGSIKPKIVDKSMKNLRNLINKHPLISPIEIREAFDFNDLDEVEKFISPLIKSEEVKIIDVNHGWFVKLNRVIKCKY